MNIEEGKAKLDDWFERGCVGNIWFFHAPGSNSVDGFIERTMKHWELDADSLKAVEKAYECYGGSRVEIYSGQDDKVDRIKVVKRL